MNELDHRGSVNVALRNAFSAHGEDTVRSRIGCFDEQVPRSPFVCPEPVDYSGDWRNQQTLVATVDGVVAGRVEMEAITYPFAELVNLEVMPAFRGRGIGSELVRGAVGRAAQLGFPMIHLQTPLDEASAHRLYTRHGFVPANQGAMLRMFHFTDIPALAQFRWEYPLAVFSSARAERSAVPRWDLAWTDPIQGSELCMGFTEGSCQSDSDGFGPGLAMVALDSAEVKIRSAITGPSSARVGDAFEITLDLTNLGDEMTKVACRLMLYQGLAAAAGAQGAAMLEVAPGDTTSVVLPAEAHNSFATGLWRWRSFPSIPVAVEVFVDQYVYLLCHQLKVETEQ